MNEAKKIQRLLVAIIFICLTVILICLLGGCSTKGHVDAAAILEYQQRIDDLEAAIIRRDATIENAVRDLGIITSRSEGMEATIDELIERFAEYDERVRIMLQDYDRVRNKTKDTGQSDNSTGYNFNGQNNLYARRNPALRQRRESTEMD